VNGALKVCVPPQEPVIVNVPVAGALANEIFPPKEYWLLEQAVGVAVIPDIEQLHEAGAVKF
jgi:hypothetical protein